MQLFWIKESKNIKVLGIYNKGNKIYEMNRIIPLLLIALLFSSCGRKGGSSSKKGFEAPPRDMVLVESGSFMMGSADEDVVWAMNASPKQVSLDAFWMDQTEVSNEMYRMFVSWTADSIARRMLGDAGIEGFFVEEDNDLDEEDEQPRLNYKTRLATKKKSSAFEEQYPVLKDGGFYYTKQEALGRTGVVDTRKLYYEYKWYDLTQAAAAKWDPKENKYHGKVTNMQGEVTDIADRSSFVMKDIVSVYPDTLCWIRDFQYSQNDPFASRYFWHPSYSKYPVVGVTWKQATAYAHWRTNFSKERMYRNQWEPHAYRLPTEAEYEYAARGGNNMSLYPWGGPYTTTKTGCFLANFKPQRGNYALDGGARTMPIATYEPNDFGLFDMAGNVAEWVNDAYDENTYSFTHDLVPTYHYNAKDSDAPSRKRKGVRGGSWKDVAYFLQCGARSYEYQDSSRSYIGFRCVRDLLGERNE